MCGVPSLPIVRTAVPVPAQLMPTRSGADSAAIATPSATCSAFGDVGLEELRRAAELLGERLTLLSVEVEDRDLGAPGDEAPDCGLTETRRSPADDRCCSLDVHGQRA